MIKLTKAQLKELAMGCGAYYFTGNLYSYENVVYFVDSYCNNRTTNCENADFAMEEAYKNTNKDYVIDLHSLFSKIINSDVTSSKAIQIAYSCGINGNTGQLHKIITYNNDKEVGTYYLFY